MWITLYFSLIALIIVYHLFVPPQASRYWLLWENLALWSTAAYSFLFYVFGFVGRRDHNNAAETPMFAGIKPIGVLGVIIMLMFGAVITPFVPALVHLVREQTWCTSWPQFLGVLKYVSCDARFHILLVICTVVMSGAFLAISVLMMNYGPEAWRSDFRESAKTNDAPTFAIFLILLLYAAMFLPSGLIDENVTPFFVGAIAFQVLLSNWFFSKIFRAPGSNHA